MKSIITLSLIALLFACSKSGDAVNETKTNTVTIESKLKPDTVPVFMLMSQSDLNNVGEHREFVLMRTGNRIGKKLYLNDGREVPNNWIIWQTVKQSDYPK